MKYEHAISVWKDMKKKLCDEYWSPYYRAKYLPQSQCDTFQVEANTMNPHPHSISLRGLFSSVNYGSTPSRRSSYGKDRALIAFQ